MNANTPWRVAGASARGTSHRKHHTPCQDAFACQPINDDWIALAVADGAGSAELSDIGSRVAVQVATSSIRDELVSAGCDKLADEVTLRAALLRTANAARDAVFETARALRRPARELASTLIVVIAGPTRTAAVHIGDGAAVIETPDGRLVTLSKPDAGEFMGESTFLVSSEALNRARVVFASEARSIALFSDGIQLLTLQYPSWEPFEPFFRQTFSFMGAMGKSGVTSHLESFLASDKLASRTDDDITLVLACRPPAPEAMLEPAPAPALAAAATAAAAPANYVLPEFVV
jgi:serine/threonine protein phosphatase PrpC